jgi:hypothetical protein
MGVTVSPNLGGRIGETAGHLASGATVRRAPRSRLGWRPRGCPKTECPPGRPTWNDPSARPRALLDHESDKRRDEVEHC